MRDLKPCPFCSSARIALLPPERIIEPWFVICDQHETCPAPSNFYATREEAVEAWNTRPREDALTEEVERLKGELAAAKSHAGEPVTWDKLKSLHSSILGTEPWKALAPNEGHRVYRQSETDACYMCAALAMIEQTRAEVEALRAALTKAREGLSIAAGWARSKPDSGNARDKIKAGLEAIRFALNPRAALKGADQ